MIRVAYATPPDIADAASARMREFDALPGEFRALANEYGVQLVCECMALGMQTPEAVREFLARRRRNKPLFRVQTTISNRWAAEWKGVRMTNSNG